MEDPESIQSVSDLTQLLPATPSTSASSRGPPSASERPQRPSIRRIRNSSIRLSHTEPTSLIVRNRTVSTTDQNNENQTEEEEFQGNCCSDPRSRCHRLIALILMCLLGFGSYFCMDNPAALQVNFILRLVHLKISTKNLGFFHFYYTKKIKDFF